MRDFAAQLCCPRRCLLSSHAAQHGWCVGTMHQFSHSPRSADRRRPRARRRGDLQRERTKGSPCSSRRQLASATQLQQASHKISPTWPWAVGGAGKLPPSLGRSFGAASGGELERRAAPPRAGALHLCTGAARCWKSNALHWPCSGCEVALPWCQRRRVRSAIGRLGPDHHSRAMEGCHGDCLAPAWAGKEGP